MLQPESVQKAGVREAGRMKSLLCWSFSETESSEHCQECAELHQKKKKTQEVKVMCGWPGELSLKRIIWRVCFIKYLSIDLCVSGNHILFMWSKSQCPSENHTCEKVFLCLNIIPFLIRKPTELGPLSNFLSSSVKNYYHHFLLSFSWSDNTLRGEKHSLKFLTHHGQGNHLILNALCPVQNHISEETRRD